MPAACRPAAAAWRVAVATRMLPGEPGGGEPGGGGSLGDVLTSGDAEQVLAAWDAALKAILAAEDLDGLATALYTVGGPVRMEGLFDAYAAAAGTRRSQPGSAAPDQAAALSAVSRPSASRGCPTTSAARSPTSTRRSGPSGTRCPTPRTARP